jgi:hypothetical protein
MKNHAWNPEIGADVAPQQRPPPVAVVLPDGTVTAGLWAPTEGPCRRDPGGAGGEPEGRSLPIRRVCWE